MKNILIATTLALVLGWSLTAVAQTDKPAAKPAAAPQAAKPAAAPAPVMAKMAEPKAAPKRMASRAHTDARECLKYETNKAIHGCAEKFR